MMKRTKENIAKFVALSLACRLSSAVGGNTVFKHSDYQVQYRPRSAQIIYGRHLNG